MAKVKTIKAEITEIVNNAVYNADKELFIFEEDARRYEFRAKENEREIVLKRLVKRTNKRSAPNTWESRAINERQKLIIWWWEHLAAWPVLRDLQAENKTYYDELDSLNKLLNTTYRYVWKNDKNYPMRAKIEKRIKEINKELNKREAAAVKSLKISLPAHASELVAIIPANYIERAETLDADTLNAQRITSRWELEEAERATVHTARPVEDADTMPAETMAEDAETMPTAEAVETAETMPTAAKVAEESAPVQAKNETMVTIKAADLKTIGSASTLDDLCKLITTKLYWAKVELREAEIFRFKNKKACYEVLNLNGFVAHYVVTFERGRYRLATVPMEAAEAAKEISARMTADTMPTADTMAEDAAPIAEESPAGETPCAIVPTAEEMAEAGEISPMPLELLAMIADAIQAEETAEETAGESAIIADTVQDADTVAEDAEIIARDGMECRRLPLVIWHYIKYAAIALILVLMTITRNNALGTMTADTMQPTAAAVVQVPAMMPTAETTAEDAAPIAEESAKVAKESAKVETSVNLPAIVITGKYGHNTPHKASKRVRGEKIGIRAYHAAKSPDTLAPPAVQDVPAAVVSIENDTPAHGMAEGAEIICTSSAAAVPPFSADIPGLAPML